VHAECKDESWLTGAIVPAFSQAACWPPEVAANTQKRCKTKETSKSGCSLGQMVVGRVPRGTWDAWLLVCLFSFYRYFFSVSSFEGWINWVFLAQGHL
jgi:hypothetical protein